MLTGVGRVKFPAAVTVTWAVGGLGITWTYLHGIHNSLIAAVMVITVARVVGSIVHLIYGIHILKISPYQLFFKAIIRPSIAGLLICMCSFFLIQYFDVYRILQFCIVSGLLGMLYAITTWVITLNYNERREILSRLSFVKIK
jgi:hypothetical protein